MRVRVEVPASPAIFEALLEGLVAVNVLLMDRSALPPLYWSGVRYQKEIGTELWQTCEQVFKASAGDCEDLACWRVAELRRAGEIDASPHVYRAGPGLWHVIVRRGNGYYEDPSRILGMGRKQS